MGFRFSRRVLRRLFSNYYPSAAATSNCGSSSSCLLSKRGDYGALFSSSVWSCSSSSGTQNMLEASFGASGGTHFQRTTATTLLTCRKLHSTESRPYERLVDSNNRFGAAEVAARGWQITEESESDWRGHAAAIARSIQLIKTRMEVRKRFHSRKSSKNLQCVKLDMNYFVDTTVRV